MTTRLKLTVEYDGTRYAGWQRQADGIISVQEEIEKAIAKLFQRQIVIHAAGRTDAGVHAEGQVCHFDLNADDRQMDPYNLIKGLNALLRPNTIAILSAKIVAPDFHARFSAINKLYRYRLLCRPAPPALAAGRVWHVYHPLDIDAVRKGAQHLIGYHDFSSFRAGSCQAKSPLRTLTRLDFTVDGANVICETESKSFLHHQVRNMVGTLVQVGLGDILSDDVKKILEARDRKAAGLTAPPDGLSLVRVDYDPH